MTRESCGRNGQLTMDEFVGALLRLSIGLTREQIRAFVRVYGGPGAEDADMCVCLYCVCVCARARVMRGKMAVAMVVGKRVSRRESAIITEACACVHACVRVRLRERERCLYVHVFVICG